MSWIRRLVLIAAVALFAGRGGAAYAAPASYPTPDGPANASVPAASSGMPLWQIALIVATTVVVAAAVAFVAGARVGRHRAVVGTQPHPPVAALG